MGEPLIVDGDLIEVGAVIETTAPAVCDLCGEPAELRPYGPNGEDVCHPCAMQDEPAARRAFQARLDSL